MELLNSSQVSERLHISMPTVSRWVKSGRLSPTMKLPGLRGPFLFSSEHIERVERERVMRSKTPAS